MNRVCTCSIVPFKKDIVRVQRRLLSNSEEINTQEFLESVRQKFNITDINGWYGITKKDILSCEGGQRILQRYNSSPSALIIKSLPEYNFQPWKFHKTQNYWSNPNNQRDFMLRLEKELQFTKKDDWYQISALDILNNGGSGILHKFKGSVSNIVASVFPEHNWLPWKFSRVPRGYWDSKANQVKYLKWLGNQLGYKGMDDYYNLTLDDIIKNGGMGLVHYFGDSTSRIVTSVFPEHNWMFWKFRRSPKNSLQKFAQDPEKEKAMLANIMKELNITNESDWFNVTQYQLRNILNSKLSGNELRELVSKYYPSVDFSKFMYIKKSQTTLLNYLRTLFPNDDVLEDYRNPDIIYDLTQFPIELDVYIPRYKLAFEYQGLQHYESVEIFHTSLTLRQQRDIEKKEKCKQAGITLVPIPYWWDHTIESLNATIYRYKPDLFNIPPSGEPIPLEYMHKFTRKDVNKNAANCLMLATNWKDQDDPTGWWICEKFDGMRVHWDPSNKELYTRFGKKIQLPKHISQELPDLHLDMELWTQYGLFQDAVAFINNKSDKKWEKAQLCVFDVIMSETPFEDRIQLLEQLRGKNYIHVVDYIKCNGVAHLEEYAQSIINKNGEGVMLREPQSLYVKGRSTAMKKFKKYLDVEVKVLEPKYPYGLECEQVDGNKVFVRFVDHKAPNVRAGAVVAIKHTGTNVNGALQNPSFFRERNDISWEDVLNEAKKNSVNINKS